MGGLSIVAEGVIFLRDDVGLLQTKGLAIHNSFFKESSQLFCQIHELNERFRTNTNETSGTSLFNNQRNRMDQRLLLSKDCPHAGKQEGTKS